MNESSKPANAFAKLIELIEKLLDPISGCPWDRQQTPKSLSSDILEETYELLEAIANNDIKGIAEEAGDLIFLIFFLARLTHDYWQVDLELIVNQVINKMKSRHPHIFAEKPKVISVEETLELWQEIKNKERQGQGYLLQSVPKILPALQRAHRLSERVSKVGFDWKSSKEVYQAYKEEQIELEEVLILDSQDLSTETKKRIKDELGDVLFCLSNLARHLGFSAEDALAQTSRKFERRFNAIEDFCRKENIELKTLTTDAWEDFWLKAKIKVG